MEIYHQPWIGVWDDLTASPCQTVQHTWISIPWRPCFHVWGDQVSLPAAPSPHSSLPPHFPFTALLFSEITLLSSGVFHLSQRFNCLNFSRAAIPPMELCQVRCGSSALPWCSFPLPWLWVPAAHQWFPGSAPACHPTSPENHPISLLSECCYN